MLVLLQKAGNPGPMMRSVARTGLVFALWNDGTLVRAKSVDNVGQNYEGGRLNETELRRIVASAKALTHLNNQLLPWDFSGFEVKYKSIWGYRYGNEPGSIESDSTAALARLRADVLSLELEDARPHPYFPAAWFSGGMGRATPGGS